MSDAPDTINPADKKAMKSMLVELTNCMRRMDDEREQMKDIAKAAEEKFEIKAKLFRKLASTMYKHNYEDLRQETEHFEFLYESLVEGRNT